MNVSRKVLLILVFVILFVSVTGCTTNTTNTAPSTTPAQNRATTVHISSITPTPTPTLRPTPTPTPIPDISAYLHDPHGPILDDVVVKTSHGNVVFSYPSWVGPIQRGGFWYWYYGCTVKNKGSAPITLSDSSTYYYTDTEGAQWGPSSNPNDRSGTQLSHPEIISASGEYTYQSWVRTNTTKCTFCGGSSSAKLLWVVVGSNGDTYNADITIALRAPS
jgi:hypothetical protein